MYVSYISWNIFFNIMLHKMKNARYNKADIKFMDM